MKNMKDILRRSMKNGFDLSFVNDYNEKQILQSLYDYLVTNYYYCSMEDGIIYVGIDIVEDIAKIKIEDMCLKVKPIKENGFFEILLTLFKFIKYLQSINIKKELDDEDISTESDDESSEEMWL